MADRLERAAMVQLLRTGALSVRDCIERAEDMGSALTVLREVSFVIDDELEALEREITAWEARGFRLHTVLDPSYPANLRAVHDRPPFVWTEGDLIPGDTRAIAVIGSRAASASGRRSAEAVALELVRRGFTVVSGLAAGIDAAAHAAALRSGGRTVAVVGTGLSHAYPPQNAPLQRRIASDCAVISQFWPDTPPSRVTFPRRNAVMSGLSLASVIIEASERSGVRIQAQRALAHGRGVMLASPLMSQTWARELAERPGVHVVHSARETVALAERLAAPDALVG